MHARVDGDVMRAVAQESLSPYEAFLIHGYLFDISNWQLQKRLQPQWRTFFRFSDLRHSTFDSLASQKALDLDAQRRKQTNTDDPSRFNPNEGTIIRSVSLFYSLRQPVLAPDRGNFQ